jgi:hypothetical protein
MSLDEMRGQVDMRGMSWVGIAAGAAALLVVGVALVVYSRRRRTLAERLREALPDRVREVPEGIRVRLKRAL